MSQVSSIQTPAKEGRENLNVNSSTQASKTAQSKNKDLAALSPDVLKALLEQVQAGQRNDARRVISRALNVNDVVAETSLRHLEDKLVRDRDYRDRILHQAATLPSATVIDHQQFLRDAFGVQGIVSKAILNHWRIAGA